MLESGGRQSGPESRTATSTSSGSVLPVVISNSRGPSLVPLMASMALMSRLRITCCSSTRSPKTSGKSSPRSVCTATPFLTASLWVSSTTSRIAPLVSTHSLPRGAPLMSARTRPMTSPARLPSLTMRTSAFLRLDKIRRLGAEPAQSRLAVRDRSANRLVHFMGDRRRELSNRSDPIAVRELHLRFAVPPLSSRAPRASAACVASDRARTQHLACPPSSINAAAKHDRHAAAILPEVLFLEGLQRARLPGSPGYGPA